MWWSVTPGSSLLILGARHWLSSLGNYCYWSPGGDTGALKINRLRVGRVMLIFWFGKKLPSGDADGALPEGIISGLFTAGD